MIYEEQIRDGIALLLAGRATSEPTTVTKDGCTADLKEGLPVRARQQPSRVFTGRSATQPPAPREHIGAAYRGVCAVLQRRRTVAFFS